MGPVLQESAQFCSFGFAWEFTSEGNVFQRWKPNLPYQVGASLAGSCWAYPAP